MFFSQVGSLLAFTALATAVPLEKVEKRWGGERSWWTPSTTTSYLEFGKRFPQADSNAPTCDLASAVMPAGEPSCAISRYQPPTNRQQQLRHPFLRLLQDSLYTMSPLVVEPRTTHAIYRMRPPHPLLLVLLPHYTM